MQQVLIRIVVSTGLLFSLLVQGCFIQPANNIPDVSNIQVDISIDRFEKKLFALDTNLLEPAFYELQEAYPELCAFYFPVILGMNDAPPGSPAFFEALQNFLQWPEIKKLYDTCSIVFPDLSQLEQELEEAFQFYSYYFPDLEVPKIYTIISEYMGAIIIPPNENAVYIGLDMFLGPSYPIYYYHPLNLPRYITHTLKPEYITARLMESLADDLVGSPPASRLLDDMIRNGKKMYLLDCLLPHTPDTIKWGFTADQMEWCYDNEAQMWQYFIAEDLLYNADYQKIRKYVSPSPDSPGMPAEAPGRTGNFIGFQIVKQYMKNTPDLPIQELINKENAQEILDQARYRPR